MSTEFNTFWSGLSLLNQALFVAAAFFSVIFAWQVIAAFTGLGGDGSIDDASAAPDAHDTPPEAHETVFLFKLVSIRSVAAFATLFSWASSLYMSVGNVPTTRALLMGLAWGAAAMVSVGLIMHFLAKLTHSGNINLAKCVGTTGSVYLDIPAGGVGEIRTLCGDTLTHIKARTVNGSALKSGASVRVARMATPDIVEVEPT
jgi:hypothetical protein